MGQLHQITFWATIFFVVFGAVLGLVGVWIPRFWDNDYSWKLFLTDCILAGSSVIVAAITKWLG